MNEFELIDYLTEGFPVYDQTLVKGIGDDCAVWKEGDDYVVFTTDTMVEGDHFKKEWMSPEQVGKRLLEINISDIAAMGACPTLLFMSLVIDDYTSPEWLKKMYAGIREACLKYNITLAGGNITHGQTLSLTVGLHGRTDKVVYRKGARPGDLLAVTGHIGSACCARLLLGKNLPVPSPLLSRFLTPEARVSEAQTIKKYASSMIDISDGIASEACHLAKNSNIGVVIDAESIPFHSETKSVEKNLDRTLLECALRGGEDFELMFSLSEEAYNELIQEMGKDFPINVIGKFCQELVYQYQYKGQLHDLPRGFDHFSENINL